MEFKEIRNYYINLNNVNYLKKEYDEHADIFLLTIVMNDRNIEFEFHTASQLSEFIAENFKTI